MRHGDGGAAQIGGTMVKFRASGENHAGTRVLTSCQISTFQDAGF
jgi:hypothetical protein